MSRNRPSFVASISLLALLLLPVSSQSRSLSGISVSSIGSGGERAATSWARDEAQIQPPAGPVTFCGTQTPPAADSYEAIVDGGAPASVTMTAPPASACPAGSTHSFTLAAALFPVGDHTVVVRATNPFGATAGPAFAVTVGIAPGQFTVTAVLPPGE